MVQENLNPETGEGQIILKPNDSESWQVNTRVALSLAIVSGIISLWFLWLGMWMILPFCGLEIAAVYTALYLCKCNNTRTEVIIFERDKVIIERGRRFAQTRKVYQRAWSKIFVRHPGWRGHLKKIFIRSHGKEQELGAFLNKQDRDALINALKHAVYN